MTAAWLKAVLRCVHLGASTCPCKAVWAALLETLTVRNRAQGRATPREGMCSQGLGEGRVVEDTCSAWAASPEGQAMLWSWHLVDQVSERHEREEGGRVGPMTVAGQGLGDHRSSGSGAWAPAQEVGRPAIPGRIPQSTEEVSFTVCPDQLEDSSPLVSSVSWVAWGR